ncbi:MAG: endopeptidase La, partial [Bdellovibrionia bacterium]
QHLAVVKLKGKTQGSILLFVGPPGVGKTSLGQSVAKALGRKFVRASLGGMRDDAEIRGHRRTYVGALPGRIVQSIKRAGENDPVFMLDEIDKLSHGFYGDPASAMLEVLDPEQNHTFTDHYLDVPFDLSNVFFIATANSLDTIPAPLLDRMEVIELSGYTQAEKLHIAKTHLIPKQIKAHGLKPEQVTLPDEVLVKLISSYTRESGVRELQRKIGSLLRAATEKVVRAKDHAAPVVVELSWLDEVFGGERFHHELSAEKLEPGVATGLAWTPQGGDILFIEATQMPGKGGLMLTGQLGDVMKESAQIALSLVRSRLPYWAPSLHFDVTDVHIHVPAGAIPKDGPSAGITIFTALASLFAKRSVSPKIAMTGEVSLRGAVLPVGGIKEKMIAAHRAGIRTVILSKRNEKDIREVPKEVKDDLKFIFVENVSEVLKHALGIEPNQSFEALGGSSGMAASA